MIESTFLSSTRHLFSDKEPSNANSMQSSAHALIQMGFTVLPLHTCFNNRCSCGKESCDSIAKHPLTKNGSKDATNNPAEVARFWQEYPKANIGIATGKESGVVVLDVDKKNNGLVSFKTIEEKIGSLSHHLSAQSGGGGFHVYFQAPKDLLLKNKANILPGIDFRGEGGYIVAPPSTHASGNQYQWLNQNKLQPVPQKLLDILTQKSDFFIKESSSYSSSEDKIGEGSRKNLLVSIGGFLKFKGLSQNSVSQILPNINKEAFNPNLPDLEVNDVIKSLSKYESVHWEKILPLTEQKHIAKPITQEHLPFILRRWISDLSYRMQVPIDFLAIPAIISISSIIGRKMAVRPFKKDSWKVIPNLWGILIASPGSMKSAAMSEALKPLEELEKRARTEFEKDCQEEAIKQKDLAFEIEAMKQSMKLDWSKGMKAKVEDKKENLKDLVRQESESDLKEKRYLTNDPTIEKLALILKDNPQGVMLFRDELSGWFESLSKSGREGSRQFYLETWGGEGSFSIDRVGRGSTFTRFMCLSIFGSIQPGPLKKYLNQFEENYGQDGFFERFQLAVYPEPLKKRKIIDEYPDEEAYRDVEDFFLKIDQINFKEGKQKIINFSEEAQNIFYSWLDCLEEKISDSQMPEFKKSHYSKYRSLLPSLALIFEAIETKGSVDSISSSSLKMAIEWIEILESHSEKIFSLNENNSENHLKSFLEKIKTGDIYDGMTVREIYRKQWRGLNTPEKVTSIINILIEHNYIAYKKSSTSGRSSESILINPSFFEGAA